jgi:hypothetical protein
MKGDAEVDEGLDCPLTIKTDEYLEKARCLVRMDL